MNIKTSPKRRTKPSGAPKPKTSRARPKHDDQAEAFVKSIPVAPFHRPRRLHEKGRAHRRRRYIKGDCYRYAWREAAAYLEAGEPDPQMRIVHGRIDYREHAWVERGGFVYDWQLLAIHHLEPIPLAEFDRRYRPERERVYTARELMAMAEYGHFGPYHGS